MYYARCCSFVTSCVTAIILCSIVLSQTLSAQKKPVVNKKTTIAVMDFDARAGLTKGEVASMSDVFNSQMVDTKEFIVVDRNRIKAILEEQGFQQSEACSQVECIVEAGKILKVEKMYAGTIGKVGNIFTVNIQLIDVSTAQIIANKSYQHDGSVEELAQEVIPTLAIEMARELTGNQNLEVTVGRRSSSKIWWYVGGAALLGGGAAAYYFLNPSSTATTPAVEKLPGPPSLP